MGGHIVHALTIEYGYHTDLPVKGHVASAYMLIRHCPWLPLFADVLATLHFEGLRCVNYKLCSGKPVLLGINPRLGRSATGYFFVFLRHLARGRPLHCARRCRPWHVWRCRDTVSGPLPS